MNKPLSSVRGLSFTEEIEQMDLLDAYVSDVLLVVSECELTLVVTYQPEDVFQFLDAERFLLTRLTDLCFRNKIQMQVEREGVENE